MTTITFESLFALMEQDLPVLNNDTCFDIDYDWTSQYRDDDRGVFLETLCDAVITVAQHEGRYKGDYNIADLDRVHVKSNFEERLQDRLTDPDYTARDLELVEEYLRTGSATPSHDEVIKKKPKRQTGITFEGLFALMEQELPVLNNDTRCTAEYEWISQYRDDDRRVFLETLCNAVAIVAHREGRTQGDYKIADLERTHIHFRFENCLGNNMDEPGYTTRDIELIREYWRTKSATPIHDVAHKQQALIPSAEIIRAREEARKSLLDNMYEDEKYRPVDEFVNLIGYLSITPSLAKEEFTEIAGTQAVEHKEKGTVWERDHSIDKGYIWKAWLEREDWEKHRAPWRVNAEGKAEAFEGMYEKKDDF